MLLTDLPDVALEMILCYLSYDEIAKNRLVCKHFDQICQKLLNRGFSLMEKHHAQSLKLVKAQLPRRESERRSHHMARHCDILTAIETRISMLSMTFIKYVNLHMCCFIPGKVIDEIFRVLRLVKESKTPPRAHEILQELRDISSMAMEHFDEKILPQLKHTIAMNSSCSSGSGSYDLPGSSLMISQHTLSPASNLNHPINADKLNESFRKIYSRTRRNKQSFLSVKARIGKLRLRVKRQGCQIRLQNTKLQEYSKKMHEQDLQLSEMRRHFEEWEQKMGDLTAELIRAREDTQSDSNIDACKHSHMDVTACDDDSSSSKKLITKKRKLIVDRKSPSDAKDLKFKKFMFDLLDIPKKTNEDTPSTSQ